MLLNENTEHGRSRIRLIETETSARISNCWLDVMKFAAEGVARQETRVEESWNTTGSLSGASQLERRYERANRDCRRNLHNFLDKSSMMKQPESGWKFILYI